MIFVCYKISEQSEIKFTGCQFYFKKFKIEPI